MKWLSVFTILILSFTSVSAQDDIVIGERITLRSELLDEERVISVYTPRTYNRDIERSYPVLYLLDGGVNLLHAAGSQYFLAGYGQMPELIIVGIHNSDRTRDLTPTHDPERANSGGADAFRAFIKEELMPYVETNYRVTNNRYLSGHSYGGLFAVDTLIKSPDMFDAYFTFSPSLRWDNHAVLNAFINALDNEHLTSYLYMNIGAEGERLRNPIAKAEAALKSKAPKTLKWRVDWLDDENHSTTPVIGQFLAYRDYFGKE